MDDKENYHTATKNYIAVRVPQVEGNAQLKKLILAGIIDFKTARDHEMACMEGLKSFDRGQLALDPLIERLKAYEAIWHGKKDDTEKYRETLQEMPWKNCECSLCKRLGIHIVLFRGAERNRSRGFHNLYVLRNRLQTEESKKR